MHRKFRNTTIVIMILCFMLFAGCLDSKDIHEKLLVTTICCDYKDGEVWLYGEFANIQASQSSNTSSGSNKAGKYFLITAHGKTIHEARLDMDMQMSQPPYLSGVRTVLLTERFAQKYLLEYLFRLRADETYRKKVITVITQDDLDKIFQTMHERDLSVGFVIEHLIETLDDSGECFVRKTCRILENLASNYCGILIPCIGLQDEQISLDGFSVVNGPVVIDFIPIEETKGLIMLKADKPRTRYCVRYQGILFTIDTRMTNKQIDVAYSNGAIDFAVSLAFEANVEYGSTKTPYNIDDAAIVDLQALLKKAIEKDVHIAIDQAQKTYKTDYLQLDDEFRIKYPVEFENMDWQMAFLNANIAINIEVGVSENPMMDYGTNKSR